MTVVGVIDITVVGILVGFVMTVAADVYALSKSQASGQNADISCGDCCLPFVLPITNLILCLLV